MNYNFTEEEYIEHAKYEIFLISINFRKIGPGYTEMSDNAMADFIDNNIYIDENLNKYMDSDARVQYLRDMIEDDSEWWVETTL